MKIITSKVHPVYGVMRKQQVVGAGSIMQIREIWPFYCQGYCFSCCCKFLLQRHKTNRKPLLCVLYILSVTVFGLAAIAFYLLRAEKKLPKDTTTEKVEKANHLTNKGIFLLLLIAYQVMGIHMLAENYETSAYIPLIWLLTFSFLIMLLYNLLPEKKRFRAEPLLPILQLALCIPIQYLDSSGDNLFLSIIAGFSAINHASLSRAKAYGMGAMGAYLLGSMARTIHLSRIGETADLIRYFFVNTIVVLLALLAFYNLKKQMITSVKLESALRTVNEQSEKLKTGSGGRETVLLRKCTIRLTYINCSRPYTGSAEGLVSKSMKNKKIQQGTDLRRGLSELRASVKVVRVEKENRFCSHP